MEKAGLLRNSEFSSAQEFLEQLGEAAGKDRIAPNQPRAHIAKALGLDFEGSRLGGMPSFDDYLVGGMRRDLHIKEYGFAILTKECLDVLARVLQGKRCLDAGAGTGYLAHHLAMRGIDVLASEKFVSDNSYGFLKHWQNDHRGDTLELLPGEFDAVLLSWPPYERSFGFDIASKMEAGQMLVYQGEGEGGCTGCDSLHELLGNESAWDCLTDINTELDSVHLQFPGIHDCWTVYRKR